MVINLCRTVCLTDPSNDQLVKDEGAQIFYSVQSQTKLIGIGANCEIPHNAAPTTWTYDRALIPLVGPCVLLICPTTNWWRMRGHKSFIAFDRRPSSLVLEQIVKSLTISITTWVKIRYQSFIQFLLKKKKKRTNN